MSDPCTKKGHSTASRCATSGDSHSQHDRSSAAATAWRPARRRGASTTRRGPARVLRGRPGATPGAPGRFESPTIGTSRETLRAPLVRYRGASLMLLFALVVLPAPGGVSAAGHGQPHPTHPEGQDDRDGPSSDPGGLPRRGGRRRGSWPRTSRGARTASATSSRPRAGASRSSTTTTTGAWTCSWPTGRHSTPRPESGPTSHLYRNLGGLRFEETTKKAGLTQGRLGPGHVRGRLRRRRPARPLRRVLRPERALPERGRRDFPRRDGSGGARGGRRALGHGLLLLRLRPRRSARPRGHVLPRVRSHEASPSRAAAGTACGRASR